MAKHQMFCGNCAMVDKPMTQPSGSGTLEAVLWIGSMLAFLLSILLAMLAVGKTGQPIRGDDAELVGKIVFCSLVGFIASVVYSIARRAGSRFVCRHCMSANVMPLHTPVAQQKVHEMHEAKMKAKYGDEVAAYRQQIRSEIGRAPAQ